MENFQISETEKRKIFLACFSAAFLTPFVLSALNIALPEIAEELHMTVLELAWLSIAFLITSFSFLFAAGKIADLYGRIKTLKFGLFMFFIFSLFCGFSFEKNQLIILRAFQGISASFIFSTSTAIISSIYPKGQRGKYLGFIATSVYLGLTLGPFLGGIMVKNFSWRMIFYFSAFISLIPLLAFFSKIKTDFKTNNKKLNILKISLYSLCFLIFSFSFSNLAQNWKLLLFSSAFLFLLFFKDKEDLFLIKSLLSNKKFIFANAASLFHYAGTFSIIFTMSLYLQYSLKLNSQKAGFIMFSMPFFMMALSPWAGKISDKKDPAKTASGGILISLAGLACFLIFPNPTSSLSFIYLAIIGIGFAFFSTSNTNFAMNSLSFDHYSCGSSFLSANRLLGQNISMSMAAFIMHYYLGDIPITDNLPYFAKSFKMIISLSLGLLVLAIFMSLKRIDSND